mmetsp:Transcript_13922/g.48499  ORF Transcript_13922/g.48499 Transcript_13922/m.48499 type:complete len:259 (+) Transcript_13922:2006-2782(+)
MSCATASTSLSCTNKSAASSTPDPAETSCKSSSSVKDSMGPSAPKPSAPSGSVAALPTLASARHPWRSLLRPVCCRGLLLHSAWSRCACQPVASCSDSSSSDSEHSEAVDASRPLPPTVALLSSLASDGRRTTSGGDDGTARPPVDARASHQGAHRSLALTALPAGHRGSSSGSTGSPAPAFPPSFPVKPPSACPNPPNRPLAPAGEGACATLPAARVSDRFRNTATWLSTSLLSSSSRGGARSLPLPERSDERRTRA